MFTLGNPVRRIFDRIYRVCSNREHRPQLRTSSRAPRPKAAFPSASIENSMEILSPLVSPNIEPTPLRTPNPSRLPLRPRCPREDDGRSEYGLVDLVRSQVHRSPPLLSCPLRGIDVRLPLNVIVAGHRCIAGLDHHPRAHTGTPGRPRCAPPPPPHGATHAPYHYRCATVQG